MRLRTILGAAAATAALLVCASPAAAHPLGNFSVNHLTVVSISADRVDVRYVLDQAEIPTFRERGAGAAELLRRKLGEVERRLSLTVDGRRAALRPAGEPLLTHPAGQGGLRTTRLELPLSAPARGARSVSIRDGTFPGRVGWKAIQVRPGEDTAVRTGAPATDPTRGLRSYPEDLLSSPSDVREADFSVRPGAGTVEAGAGRRAGAGTAGGRRLRRAAGRRRRARPPAARRVRLGRAARAVAGARQGDGRGLPRRHARQHARRRDPRRRGHRDAHGGRGRARLRRARTVGVGAARAALPVAHARLRADGRRRRRRGAAPPRAAPTPMRITTTTTTITTTAGACSRWARRPA